VYPSEIARRDEIRRIGAERFGAAAATLAAAYRADPLVVWSLAADTTDLDDEAHERYWRGVLSGLPAGSEVHATYGVEAVAVWRPVADTVVAGGRAFELVALGVEPANRGRGLARRLSEVMFARADRVGTVLVAHVSADGTPAPGAIRGVVAVGSAAAGGGGPVRVEYRREPDR
jgi:GNAT superfamily N-acetyltransferase